MKLNQIITEATDWSKFSDEQLELVARMFALGPKYKPKPRKTYKCGGCEKDTAYYKTRHEDTDMEETTLYCPDCGWTKGNI